MSRDPGAPVRVVIVDDHPVVRDGLRGMLAVRSDSGDAGSVPSIDVVGEAGDGRHALVVIGATDPDVVLLDLRMPGGDGVDAIRALRAVDLARPRILVLTTYDTDRDIRAALDAGADGYLLKDTRRADLVRAVHDLAQGRAVLSRVALEVMAGRRRLDTLSPRELDVLRLIAEGGTNRSAAERLFVSEATVKTHLLHAYAKLGVGDRAAAVRVAYERGLL